MTELINLLKLLNLNGDSNGWPICLQTSTV